MDRFIPDRSAMDLRGSTRNIFASRGGRVEMENTYIRLIAESLDMNRTIILGFNNRAPSKPSNIDVLRHVPKSPVRTLNAPDIEDDLSLNLLDWSGNNVIAIVLGHNVYLWNAFDKCISAQLDFTDDGVGPVTSVKWAPDGQRLAVGLNNSHVQVWKCDSSDTRLLRTLEGGHQSRVSSLDWRNNHILTSGGLDGLIINNDLRKDSHIVSKYMGRRREVSRLKWCSSGQQLASGGNDKLLYIWSASSNRCIHRLNHHSAAVNALSWCPFQSNLLASSGSAVQPCIKFWNTNTGACMNSVNTGSEVCSLLWNTIDRELLSGHRHNENLLTLWKYPSMVRIAELYDGADTSRVLSMAKSPDGYNVATIASDETLRIWNIFETSPITQKKRGEPVGPFPDIPRIR